MGPHWHRTLAYLTVASIVLQHAPVVFAERNEFQPFTLDNPSPGDWDEIKKVVIEGEEDDPDVNIHANLQEAMCGGWDFNTAVNGVFGQGEQFFVGDQAIDTDPDEGLISIVKGVPGRDLESAYGIGISGLGARRENGGNVSDIAYNEALKKREKTGNFSGFTYPINPGEVCGLSTLCRPPSHPDRRSPPVYQNHGLRDSAKFFCEHPCQRPLDNPGKPQGWDPADSSSAECGKQQPYAPAQNQVKYSCGGLETKGPGEDFCAELNANGTKGGLCQDMNNWVYILWSKLVHICITPTFVPVPIFLNEKGSCGFPAELDGSEHSQNKRADGWTESGVFECCSDNPFPGGKNYNFDGGGISCKPCNGEECRLDENTFDVISNDVWLQPFPADVPGGCLIGIPAPPPPKARPEDPDPPDNRQTLIDGLTNIGLDPGALPANIGPWADPDPNLRLEKQPREYISFFREYVNASYERADMDPFLPNDDHKKENIPVACYGMYDLAPENALVEQTDAEDKRCVIAAYYEANDGDGDQTNFWSMKDTQRGRGFFKPGVTDDPFRDPLRRFDKEQDLWFPEMGNAFSLINKDVFNDRFNGDLSFALLTTDSAKQRVTVQLDQQRKLSEGALIRSFDDTITRDRDLRIDRRTVVEWWHVVETEMHKSFTPPTVRMLLPTTWSVDVNPLDPIYTPPLKKGEEEEDNQQRGRRDEEEEEEEQKEDPQAQAIEVQVQAGENLLGDIASFMERNLLLRVDSEPIPVVVPMANPTELRAWAQGWQTWAQKQEDEGLDGAGKAREVADKLLEYADQADNVRKLRGELPKYAGKLLAEQAKISTKIAKWLTDNIEAYESYRALQFGNQLLSQMWQFAQKTYRSSGDNATFPWCRNSRFTAPIYSMLDPWLPGREFQGDVSGGFKPFLQCSLNPILCQFATPDIFERTQELFGDYNSCLEIIGEFRAEKPDRFPTNEACDKFFPLPPAFPQIPETIKDGDIVLDFTAFREVQKKVKLPVLKPIQIRIDFNRVRPPGLEDDDEPEYPELADFPELPTSISEDALESIPAVISPGGEDFDLFKEAALLAVQEDDPEDEFPKIEIPQLDILSLALFLFRTIELIEGMTKEYDLFWKSLVQEPCKNGETEDCIRPNTQQDCVKPHDDPNGRCVHFEGDLRERMQRIGSRGAIFFAEDFLSVGQFRKPLTHGQTYCRREDWACQLLNAYKRIPRDGWQLDISDEYDPDKLMQELRENVRDASSNILENEEDQFLFDLDQNTMFENFRVPEGEKIERYIERFEPVE